jgi:hypothetical protein
MERDYKVEEISTGRIIQQIDLDRIYMETTLFKVIEMPSVGKKWRGGMKGKIGLGDKFKLKHKEGGVRENGKIDCRVKLLGRGVGKRHMDKARDRGEEGRRGWEYLGIYLGDWHFLSLFLNGVKSGFGIAS